MSWYEHYKEWIQPIAPIIPKQFILKQTDVCAECEDSIEFEDKSGDIHIINSHEIIYN